MTHRLAVLMALAAAAAAQAPPPTAVHPVTDNLHGVSITDNYRWLEDQNSPETRAWLDAQIKYTESFLSRIPVRGKVKQRLTELSRIDSYGLPIVRGDHYFFSRRLANENRASICMRSGVDGKDEVVVNPSDISQDESTTVSLGGVTRDGKLLIYGIRHGGEDEEEFRILNLETHQLLADRLPRARYFGLAIKDDHSGFFYSRYTTAAGSRVFYHAMGQPASDDRMIFGEGHGPDTIIDADLSEDGKYLLVDVNIGVPPKKVEVWVENVEKGGPLVPIVNDLDAEFRPFIRGDRLYLWTNWKAPNWRVLGVDLEDPARDRWKEIVPEARWPIDGAAGVAGRLFVKYLEDVNSHVKEYDPEGKYLGDLKLPGIGSVFGPSGRWAGDEAFFYYTSFADPATIYRYTPSREREQVWFRPPVPIHAEDYEVKQVWYDSRDKTRVPMFLVYRKGLKLDGRRPVLLTGYGGFSVSLTPTFSSIAALWTEMGGVFAQPSLRGGGEFGEKWHHAGMFEHKQNVFEDFIAAAEWLIANRYTAAGRIGIEGTSNGGLLVGAAITQRPDLFGAAVCGYPLLDMLRYQKFKVGSYWVTEYGSSDDAKQLPYLLRYSPYQNVHKGTKYPAVMFVSGDFDTRVDPLHARKMAALMQAANGGDKPILLKYDTKSGHSGGKPLNQQIDDNADWLGFLLQELGAS
ncbi:MAG TPA: prolyl oligopeptidase family serine peptidase [Bryobacteraceae bacterium]|nr:prolyl oligopeptidase family serine peptidase [Bryobacteraceae bacterium]